MQNEPPRGFRLPRWALVGATMATAVVGTLAFAVFGVHTLFVDAEVDEAVPVFASGAAPSGLPSDVMTVEEVDEMQAVMTQEGTPVEEPVEEDMPMEGTPEIVVDVSGTFVDRSHPAEGTAEVLGDGSGQRFLRFEDFATDNGPDLNVYLSAAPPDAPAGEFDDDFIDLGDLKGNIGPQNYEIPADVDLSRYRTVVIWCVRFGVAFGVAELAPA